MNRSMTDTANAHNVRVDVFAKQMRALSRHEREQLIEEAERVEVAELERAAIARRIKQARQEAGLSQPEMADALGVISRTYQNYESVKQPRIPWGSMNDIAKITGKTTEWLIHGDSAERETPNLFAGQATQLDRLEQAVTELALREADASHEREGIMALLATQSKILADITALLARQDSILAEIQRVVAGMPDDENLRMLNEAAQELAEIAERRQAARTETSSGQADAHRRAAGEP